MSNSEDSEFVYLLVDNSLLHETSREYREANLNSRPMWLEPIYSDRALEVSPLLIDVEAAYDAGDIDRVMVYLNARKPALHVSIIESELKLKNVVQHLRRFIFILDPEGRQLTLRYADCSVIATLAFILTKTQWATLKSPISRWGIHSRAGSIIELPLAESDEYLLTPLRLEREQLAALDEASEPDHFIAKVKMMNHGKEFPGNVEEQHAWTLAARQIWRSANNSNKIYLINLTKAALVTRGEILYRRDLQECMALEGISMFRERLKEIVSNIRGGECEI